MQCTTDLGFAMLEISKFWQSGNYPKTCEKWNCFLRTYWKVSSLLYDCDIYVKVRYLGICRIIVKSVQMFTICEFAEAM